MATTLKFELGGTDYEAAPVKLDRKKLYGYTELVATDSAGGTCLAAKLDPDGSLVVPPRGIKSGIISASGKWMDRSDLKAVDAEGNEIPVASSSFGQTIVLEEEADEEDFLDHVWKSVYQLDNPDLAASGGNRIFKFDFCYRAGTFPTDGFILAANGTAYLFSGDPIDRDFVGLDDATVVEENPADENIDADDELDFNMI